jgi:hypothetical protein
MENAHPDGNLPAIKKGHSETYSTICKNTCCPDLCAAALKRFRTAVMVCPLRPITLPTSDFRISTLKINLRPCSTFVTSTSSGASTSCLMTNSRNVSTGDYCAAVGVARTAAAFLRAFTIMLATVLLG